MFALTRIAFILGSSLLLGAVALSARLPQAEGTVVGRMSFIDGRSKKWLSTVPKATVRLSHNGRVLERSSDELGHFVWELEKGRYCLESARNSDGLPLNFLPRRHACFRI